MAILVGKVLKGLVTALILVIFVSAGMMKLTDRFSKKMHEKMKKEFVDMAKVHPAALWGHYKIDPDKYRTQIGTIELACATFMVFGPRSVKLLTCLVMSSVMFGVMFSQYMLNHPQEMIFVPAAVLFLLFLKIHFLLSGDQIQKQDGESKKTK